MHSKPLKCTAKRVSLMLCESSLNKVVQKRKRDRALTSSFSLNQPNSGSKLPSCCPCTVLNVSPSGSYKAHNSHQASTLPTRGSGGLPAISAPHSLLAGAFVQCMNCASVHGGPISHLVPNFSTHPLFLLYTGAMNRISYERCKKP